MATSMLARVCGRSRISPAKRPANQLLGPGQGDAGDFAANLVGRGDLVLDLYRGNASSSACARPSGWGSTGNIPGFGLLTDQFPDARLHHSHYGPGLAPAMYDPGGRVPLKPMCGTIGVAPAEPGLPSIIPPRYVGGNMDVRDIAEGTELWLPIEVDGAIFSVGDTHAAKGTRGLRHGHHLELERTLRLVLHHHRLRCQVVAVANVPNFEPDNGRSRGACCRSPS